MNWSRDKSIVLSQFCVCAFGLLLAVLDVFGYWLVGFFIQLRNRTGSWGRCTGGGICVQHLCLDGAVAACGSCWGI